MGLPLSVAFAPLRAVIRPIWPCQSEGHLSHRRSVRGRADRKVTRSVPTSDHLCSFAPQSRHERRASICPFSARRELINRTNRRERDAPPGSRIWSSIGLPPAHTGGRAVHCQSSGRSLASGKTSRTLARSFPQRASRWVSLGFSIAGASGGGELPPTLLALADETLLGGPAAVVCSRTRGAALSTDRPLCNARWPHSFTCLACQQDPSREPRNRPRFNRR